MTLQSKFDAAYHKERTLYRKWMSNPTRANREAWLKAREAVGKAHDALKKAEEK